MSLISQFSQGVQTSIDRASLKPSEWICDNFKHPRNDRLPWSFKDHEFQIEIVDDTHRDKCVKKCAQVGLSELSIRDSLAFCAMNDYLKMAYVLPTAKFSTEFSSTRFSPAIDSSVYVRGLVASDVDSAGVKKIGTCFLVMRGTSGTTTAISIDLDKILTDEIDFCNQDVLGSFASRLQHSEHKITTDFSTPTLPDFGITALYNNSTKARYMVRHSKCGNLVNPAFYTDLIIPGFDHSMADFSKEDRFHPGIPDAYLECPSCRGEIPWTDFCDPSRREWVHAHPSRDKQGYHVMPWDVPRYNPLPDVLSSIGRYTKHSDWVNFRLGQDYASAENSFLKEVIDRNTGGQGYSLETLENSGVSRVFIGADLGKTSWIVVGVHTDSGLHIICANSVRIAEIPENNLGLYLTKMFRNLLGQRIIVDAAPNYETAMYLHNKLYEKQAYGCYYGSPKTSTLDIYKFNEAEGVATFDRTGSFDDTAKAVNNGTISFAKPTEIIKVDDAEVSTMSQHLMAMKKVAVDTARGKSYSWVNTGPDHFAHALNYCYGAYASVVDRTGSGSIITLPPNMGKVRLKDIDVGNGDRVPRDIA